MSTFPTTCHFFSGLFYHLFFFYNYTKQSQTPTPKTIKPIFSLIRTPKKFFSSLVAPGACGKPPTIDDGIILAGIKEQYAENDQVTYGCPLYYTIEGGPYKTCINGEWIGEIRCNKPCIVDRDAMNRQNIEFKYSRHDRIYSGHNDMIEFRCKRGTKVGPVSMRQRCVDGVIDLPTCSGR
uniref:Sushi domain-containing protein n=1 Tax=Gouania willdenowi TaxID=441366 RepID=A0A8C5E306_GOUWI